MLQWSPGEPVDLRLRVWSLRKIRQGALVFLDAQCCASGAMLTLVCKTPALLAVEPSLLRPGAIVRACGVVEAPRARSVSRPVVPPADADADADADGDADGDGGSDWGKEAQPQRARSPPTHTQRLATRPAGNTTRSSGLRNLRHSL